MADASLMEKIVSLAKRRGFVFPGSEIYGGLAGTYDYGPMGVLLKENIKSLWLKMFRDDRDDMFAVDAAILMNPKVWEASGHVSGFSDPLLSCLNCKRLFRVDHLIPSLEDYQSFLDSLEAEIPSEWKNHNSNFDFDALFRAYGYVNTGNLQEKLKEDKATAELIWGALPNARKYLGPIVTMYLSTKNVSCPACDKDPKDAWGWPVPGETQKIFEARQFNMMFKTQIGATEDPSSISYLRPETAGGIFVNYKNVVDSMHPKLPFGIAQIGKAFRNEIAPRDFIFRLRELEQMEVEYFVNPKDWERAFEEWRKGMHHFAEAVGLKSTEVHELEVSAEDRAHYSKRTIDFEFDYPFGRKELWGLAYRTDFDLDAHQKGSGANLEYLDEETKEKFLPHVIEPSLGVDRTLLAILASAYREDDMNGEVRTYLALSPRVAPIKAMVAPLLKNKPELVAKAREVREMLRKVHPAIAWDDNGNIGKRYRRQDEIGTPFCITIDFDTLGEKPELKDTVTLRHRDSGEQERLTIEEVKERIHQSIL